MQFATAARRTLSRSPHGYRMVRRWRTFARYLRRKPHDPDFAAFGLFTGRRGLFLDIGANVGQSALSFRVFHDGPILSIEPNVDHRRDLQLLKRLIRNFDYLMVAAGEENTRAMLRIPRYRGANVTGEASLLRSSGIGGDWASRHLSGATDEFTILEREVEVRRLDDL